MKFRIVSSFFRKKRLRDLETELKYLYTLNDDGEELFNLIRTMLEILNGFAEGINTDEKISTISELLDLILKQQE